MEKVYLPTRIELTSQLISQIAAGYMCYRVRTECQCRPVLTSPERNLKANQRNGVLVIEGDTIIKMFVRCKVCSS